MSHIDSLIRTTSAILEAMPKEPALTLETIKEKTHLALTILPFDLEPDELDQVIKRLESRFNVHMGEGRAITDNTNHEPWLDAFKPQCDWAGWNRYREYLLDKKGMPPAVVASIDKTTDAVLGLLESPEREGAWDRRGLVVGHVQSGKTGNFIGLINKAADAGYQIIIVLAGLHNNLRAQTQIRVDEGILGYESKPIVKGARDMQRVGVGLLSPQPRPSSFTHRGQSGDFNRSKANTYIGAGREATILVVKKNSSVLKNLITWAKFLAGSHDGQLVRNLPLLVIDDEADQASIDTKEQAFDENGLPDEEHDPTAINKGIRKLLNYFEKAAYVGYTATPFANIFIHESSYSKDIGYDLFPQSFIINLPTPSNYDGPARIFGIQGDTERDSLPLIDEVADYMAPGEEDGGWMPLKHKKDHRPKFSRTHDLPDTLREAVMVFILSCAGREARGQVASHKSMLIHVTRFNNVQSFVKQQVSDYMRDLKDRILLGEGAQGTPLLDTLRELWETNFLNRTARCNDLLAEEDAHSDFPLHPWESIAGFLKNVVNKIQILEVNGLAKEVLDYEGYQKQGLYVIAIGGDKLSRGLTLEGLSVSYFLRASKMYDTLMQMGRWFGYRQGYLDLCRLYTTGEIAGWFRDITEAAEELRASFEIMVTEGSTPRQYGLRIKDHPTMMVTSQVKMRHGKSCRVSFAGTSAETVVFNQDLPTIEDNLTHTTRLVQQMGAPIEGPSRTRGPSSQTWATSYLWEDVAPDTVIGFLKQYRTHEGAVRVNPSLMATYIEQQVKRGELIQWTVLLVGAKGKEVQVGPYAVKAIERAKKRPTSSTRDPLAVGRLLAPRDESIDLTSEAYQEALQKTTLKNTKPGEPKEPPSLPSGPQIRLHRPNTHGLLMLYPLMIKNHESEPTGFANPDLSVPIIGLGVSFPASGTAEAVTYQVNNVFWDQEQGGY